MNLAIDTSVFSVWRAGAAVGFAALAIIAFAERRATFYAGVALLAVAIALMSMRRAFLVLQNATTVSENLLRTLALLSLVHRIEDRGVVIPAAEMKVGMRPIGRRTLVSFQWRGEETERRVFLAGTLLKHQRTIRTLF
ncbi:MAG TPA: hypothetical protein VIL97_03510 [Thermoanaerobaculia bacterium]